jgi:hypothetical protein
MDKPRTTPGSPLVMTLFLACKPKSIIFCVIYISNFFCFFFQVEYDFEYYKLEMATDVQMLTLSEGKSNILPSDLVVPFRPSTVPAVSASPEELESWRWYLATVRSLAQLNEPEILQVTIPQSQFLLSRGRAFRLCCFAWCRLHLF